MAEQDETRRIKPGGIRGSQEPTPEDKPEPDPKAKPTTQAARRGNAKQ